MKTETPAFDLREAFQAFLRQVQQQQWAEAEHSADRISGSVGANHVVSLRARGYLALKRNDLPLARSQYLHLQQLLPEDREAGLNLALIDWRHGDRESAARRIDALAEKFPNDPEVRALSRSVRTP